MRVFVVLNLRVAYYLSIIKHSVIAFITLLECYYNFIVNRCYNYFIYQLEHVVTFINLWSYHDEMKPEMGLY